MKEATVSIIALVFYAVLLVLSACLMTVPGGSVLWFCVMAVVAIMPLRAGPRRYRIIGAIAIVIAVGLMAMDYYSGVRWRERLNHSTNEGMENTSMFFKNMFFKKKKEQPIEQYIVAQLNARLRPMDRGEIFEDVLNEKLKQRGFGEVSGGGSSLYDSGEIEYCDIEIQVSQPSEEVINLIRETLENLGAPKGSKLKVESDDREIPFGVTEGMVVYLNGTDLPDETYKKCDSNFVLSEFNRLLAGEGRVFSYWQGSRETAIYMYGSSFEKMKARILNFTATYPLCQKCRIEKIA